MHLWWGGGGEGAFAAIFFVHLSSRSCSGSFFCEHELSLQSWVLSRWLWWPSVLGVPNTGPQACCLLGELLCSWHVLRVHSLCIPDHTMALGRGLFVLVAAAYAAHGNLAMNTMATEILCSDGSVWWWLGPGPSFFLWQCVCTSCPLLWYNCLLLVKSAKAQCFAWIQPMV